MQSRFFEIAKRIFLPMMPPLINFFLLRQTQYDSIISELQSLYMENIGNQLLRWQKLIQRTANKVGLLTKDHIIFIYW